MKTPRPWTNGRAALQYKGRARDLLLALKHGDRPEIARPAGLWMARAARPILKRNLLVAPVPLHWTRLLKRRYNQSALLGQVVAQDVGLTMCPDLLIRTKRTRSLEGKTAAQRFAELSSAIQPHPKRRHRMAGRGVLLIDDVMTSGATLAACAQACRAGGATEVHILTLARVAKDD